MPEQKKSADKKLLRKLADLKQDKRFLFLFSLIIAFFVWVVVAMYASPEEVYTIYNVPITVDTTDTVVSQKGYTNFWQSDTTVDVTVTGPRYQVTNLTADDILAEARLGNVSSTGVSSLPLRVSVIGEPVDVEVSNISKTTIQVYFDVLREKAFNVTVNEDLIKTHIADGYVLREAALSVAAVTLTGPATEVDKIVSVSADPDFGTDALYKSTSVPVTFSFSGESSADTVSANKYVTVSELMNNQEYSLRVGIDRQVSLPPYVVFSGTPAGKVNVSFDAENVALLVDTDATFDAQRLQLLTVDYADLTQGTNEFNVKLEDVTLPRGVRFAAPQSSVTVTVAYEPDTTTDASQ